MTYLRWIIAALALAVSMRANAAPLDLTALDSTTCEDEDLYKESFEATLTWRCGYLVTTENEEGDEIELAVAVIMPRDKQAAARTPTVFIHGGPGFGVVKDWWSFAATRFAQEAPLILFDQRGVGLSSPKLCPELDQDRPELDKVSAEETTRVTLAQVKSCLASLKKDGVDLAAYGTEPTVRDLETLRTALKIDRWNIFGVSYGTAVGLAYIARHPDRIHAAVLDSVYAPEMQAFTTIVPDFMNTLAAMKRLCDAQARCHAKFADLPAALSEAIKSLDEKPMPITVRSDGNARQRYLSGSTLLNIVQSSALFSSEWQYAPLLVDDARARRPSKLLAQAFQRALDDIQNQNTAVYLATECAERMALEDRAALKQTAARWPEIARAAQIELQLDVCSLWPARRNAWRTPHNTTVKTMVVAGEWDPVTPASQAQRTANILGPNAKFFPVPRTAHAPTFGTPCAEAAAAQFLNNPGQGASATCAAAVAPVLATRVVSVDEVAASDFKPTTGVSFVVTLALLSAFVWPISRIFGASAAANTPLFLRSTFWLTIAVAGFIASAAPLRQIIERSDQDAQTWLATGVPVEAWPTFLLLALALTATAVAVVTLLREIGVRAASHAALAHRAVVLIALGAAVLSFANLGLLDQLPDQIADEIKIQARRLAP